MQGVGVAKDVVQDVSVRVDNTLCRPGGPRGDEYVGRVTRARRSLRRGARRVDGVSVDHRDGDDAFEHRRSLGVGDQGDDAERRGQTSEAIRFQPVVERNVGRPSLQHANGCDERAPTLREAQPNRPLDRARDPQEGVCHSVGLSVEFREAEQATGVDDGRAPGVATHALFETIDQRTLEGRARKRLEGIRWAHTDPRGV